MASFVERFGPPGMTLDPASELELELQKAPDPSLTTPRGLLGISILGRADPRSFEPQGEGTRVDAAIHAPGQATLLIEVKTIDLLDGAQLNRHAAGWGLETAWREDGEWIAPSSWTYATWADVWRWARAEGTACERGAVSAFLLDQFTEYLDIQGFAPWAGFSEADFAFFSDRTAERQAALRSKMAGLWESVLEHLAPEERDQLGTIHTGRIKARDPAWAQTNRDDPGVNLTVELGGDGLQLNIVGWQIGQAAALVPWLDGEWPQRLPRSMEVVVWERQATVDRSGKPYWMGAGGTELRRFSLVEVGSGAFTDWRERWETVEKTAFTQLAYHVRRTWSRGEVVSRGEEIAAELVDDVRAMIPAMAAINRKR